MSGNKPDILKILNESEEMFTEKQSDYLARRFAGAAPADAAQEAYGTDRKNALKIAQSLSQSNTFIAKVRKLLSEAGMSLPDLMARHSHLVYNAEDEKTSLGALKLAYRVGVYIRRPPEIGSGARIQDNRSLTMVYANKSEEELIEMQKRLSSSGSDG